MKRLIDKELQNYDYSALDTNPSLLHGHMLNLGPYPFDYPRFKKHRVAIKHRIKIKAEYKREAEENLKKYKRDFPFAHHITGKP